MIEAKSVFNFSYVYVEYGQILLSVRLSVTDDFEPMSLDKKLKINLKMFGRGQHWSKLRSRY